MNEILSVFRSEKKYEVDLQTESVLTDRLQKLMEADPHNGISGYMVRSLYFDGIYDGDYFDKVDGLEYRKKIRLRIYSPSDETVKLEIKEKKGSAQLKSSLVISRENAKQLIEGNYTPLLAMDNEIAKRAYLIMTEQLYRPRCIVEYDRKAFIHHANDIRITLDTGLRTCDDPHRFFEEDPILHPVFLNPILEVKYNGFLLGYLRYAVNLADLPEQAISKYEHCRKANHYL